MIGELMRFTGSYSSNHQDFYPGLPAQAFRVICVATVAICLLKTIQRMAENTAKYARIYNNVHFVITGRAIFTAILPFIFLAGYFGW